MAKADVTEQSNQLNLTVVALVALVAIVGLVALVLYTASAASGGLSTGVEVVSAEDVPAGEEIVFEGSENLAGSAVCYPENYQCINGQWGCRRYKCR